MKKQTPETATKGQIKDWLTLKGWFHHHQMAGMGSYPGQSDIIAMKNGIVLFIEIKSKTGVQSKKQEDYEKSVTDAGCHYILARGYEDIENYILRI